MSLGDFGRDARTISMERDDVVSLVREAVAANAGIWIHVGGTSMVPAIPARSDVHLAPLPAGSPRKGDVVLAIRDSGSPMLHRVRRVEAGRVEMKGDNSAQPDHAFDLSTIIAIADLVMVDGQRVRMDERPGATVWMRMAQLHQRVRVAISRMLRRPIGALRR